MHALEDPEVKELCKRNVVSMWIGHDSHAVLYPVRGGNEFNLVLTQPDTLPPDVRTEAGNLQEMRALFRGWDPA